MAIRESINNHPGIASGVTLGVIAVAVILIGMQLFGSSGESSKQWYTTDDSSPEAAAAALFVDDNKKLPPFDKDGKKAYVAHVFSCDNGKTRFVARVERYTEPARAKMEEYRAQGLETVDALEIKRTLELGIEVKAPGPGPWVLQSSDRAEALMLPTCPDGSIAQPVNP